MIQASYSEEFGLVINEDFHDVGVFAPGETWSWCLICTGCTDEEWMITDLQLVADMHEVSEALISMFEAGEEGVETSCGLGVKKPSEKMAVAEEMFNLDPIRREEWPRGDQAITLRSRTDARIHSDELWKFSVEIRLPGWDGEEDTEIKDELDRCRANRLRACWDPHNYKHPVGG